MSGISNIVRAAGGASGGAEADRRSLRRAGTRAEIVAAAWELVREHGLAGLSMRDLGARVGMKAQSLYSYFPSKDAIYDAMFHEGYVAFREWMAPLDRDVASEPDLRIAARAGSHRFFAFCASDPVRYQLLFQRTIPGFVPSPASYAVAVEALDQARAILTNYGITDPEAVDLWTAVMTGLVDQQLSNDPGGDRWERLIDRAVDMLLAEVAPATQPAPSARPQPATTKRRTR